MSAPTLDPTRTHTLADTPYIKLFELVYEDGTHYYTATRRPLTKTCALKSERELMVELPDAVGCCLVLAPEREEPRIVLFHEYRYPCGQFLLSIPSGLIDEADRQAQDAIASALSREIEEECGITLTDADDLTIISPFLFNTPGLTDESCALVCVTVRSASASSLSHAHAQGSERMGRFVLLTKDEAREVLSRGRDDEGHFLPMITWCALTHFTTRDWG